MATIDSRAIIDKMIAGNGYFEDDARVVMIVEYKNMFNGGTSYGVTWENEPPATWYRYLNSPNCMNPRVIWSRDDAYITEPRRS